MSTSERQLILMPMSEITPYANNPRTFDETDVERLAESIRRYGYQAPLIVDPQGVIVVGHMRYEALLRLGVDEVAVLVMDEDPAKIAEYRIIDNRAGELVAWDRDLLIPELREFTDQSHLALFFPDIDLSMDFSNDTFLLDESDLAKAQTALDKRMKDRTLNTRSVTCPHCQHVFEITS